ncbi:zinc finger HIT domain-containing protein 3 [Copidosoma floridanum]|uniref:zinc finger HIT domain-containing protein 3 n=1 Tax=Copidosoma floridanum TaxID=29053 RepID=UPI0006C9B7EF|nr:zinc finger HIT domain-containing protein 3 [Copidosoma floridanum]
MGVKACCVCASESTKYKCPKCKKLYCSAICCNKHKEKCSGPTESVDYEIHQSSSNKEQLEYDFPTEDTVPIEKLEQLRYSEGIKNCLRNPQVRDIITSVLQNENPTKAIAEAMTEPVFVELADECLKVVEVLDDDKPC